MITPENITSHEFIGLYTEVARSSNPQIIGLNGRIVNETKSMFTINTEKGTKSIAKSNNSWKFSIQEKEIIVEGSEIAKRPYDRLERGGGR
ncbi:MAG: ribonuclease P protein component 1 [Nitrosopumilus sp.]|uniref:ribonuclease P protein component 1 n=1 Tax=Nitrosopumilus sp. TaxID=2024843 RepID=UPI00292CED61|nr:ribonuclease P protein subunit [Nitrosopumilus sp.]